MPCLVGVVEDLYSSGLEGELRLGERLLGSTQIHETTETDRTAPGPLSTTLRWLHMGLLSTGTHDNPDGNDNNDGASHDAEALPPPQRVRAPRQVYLRGQQQRNLGVNLFRGPWGSIAQHLRRVLCALRFFTTGSFQSSVGSEETVAVTQPAVSKSVRRVAQTIVNAGTRNKRVHFPRTAEEKAAVTEGFLRLGSLPGVIGCVDGSFVAIVAPRGQQKAAFFCRKGYYALNVMFICDADMPIFAVDPLRPGSDHDSHIWGTTWVRERFEEGRIDTTGEYLLGDSAYPLEPWLLVPVPGHPHKDSRRQVQHCTCFQPKSRVG
ncbi:putative nuclease HARBI1 [Rhipicephalus sanguineus]|uniref:putative nuclease HARBI1 n=1 Tax=Rhipicephalus sanguineus TaxID=34632 RepID=UPI00189504C0|nr:putative nuclease HARBI1 [Rhipicephalus sanguineus]